MRRLLAALLVATAISASPSVAASETQEYGSWTITNEASRLDGATGALASAESGDGTARLVIGCTTTSAAHVFLYFVNDILIPQSMTARWKFDNHPIRTGTWRVATAGPLAVLTGVQEASFIAEATDATSFVIQIGGRELVFDLTGAVGAIGSAQSYC